MPRVLFGECTLDPECRVLARAGREVHVTPKAFDLLDLLVSRRPRALAKSELMDALWPGVAVTEGSLANLVSEVRLAIGDSTREARYVRTVHRFGYAFCAEARVLDVSGAVALPDGPRFRLSAARGEADLSEGDHLIGRAEDCRLRIDSSTVSRHHARVRVHGGEAWVEDLGSKNGTLVEGQRIAQATRLHGGERLQVGAIEIRVSLLSGLASTETFTLKARPSA